MQIVIKTQVETEDDRQDVRRLLSANDMALALSEIRDRIFRPARKHGYPQPRIAVLVMAIDSLIEAAADTSGWPKDPVTGAPETAGCLIGLLEDEFNSILEEYNLHGIHT